MVGKSVGDAEGALVEGGADGTGVVMFWTVGFGDASVDGSVGLPVVATVGCCVGLEVGGSTA
jgi:hypothetical protein